jgi:hypothetical protein
MTTCKVNIRRVLLSQVKKLKLNLDTNTTNQLKNCIYWDLSRRENHMYIIFYLRYKAIYNEQLKKDLY